MKPQRKQDTSIPQNKANGTVTFCDPIKNAEWQELKNAWNWLSKLEERKK